ncbi:hypothetical protein ACJX0J_034960, partial [Zea mays]
SKGRWGWISPSQHRTTGCTRALPSSARSANGTSETDKGHERILETINTVGHDGGGKACWAVVQCHAGQSDRLLPIPDYVTVEARDLRVMS